MTEIGSGKRKKKELHHCLYSHIQLRRNRTHFTFYCNPEMSQHSRIIEVTCMSQFCHASFTSDAIKYFLNQTLLLLQVIPHVRVIGFLTPAAVICLWRQMYHMKMHEKACADHDAYLVSVSGPDENLFLKTK